MRPLLNGQMGVPRELNGFTPSKVDWDLLWDNAVYNLFTTSDGRFQMSFYLDLPDEARCFMERYIRAYGGKICRSTDDIDSWTIVLKACPSFVNYGRPCFMLSYVTDCMADREIRDINGYILNNSSALCVVNLMKAAYYRTMKFSGKLVLDHVHQYEQRKEGKLPEPELQDRSVQTVAIGSQSDWHHEMADIALKAHLKDIEARDKVAVLRKIARSCGGSSFVVQVQIEPIVSPTLRRKAPRERRISGGPNTRYKYLEDDSASSVRASSSCPTESHPVSKFPAPSGNQIDCNDGFGFVFQPLQRRSSDVPTSTSSRDVIPEGNATLEKSSSPIYRTQSAVPESDVPVLNQDSSNSEIVNVDLNKEILSDFKEFLSKKSVPRAEALAERFNREKLAEFVKKQRSSPASHKYRNVDRKALQSLRLRVKSLLKCESNQIKPFLWPERPREICLSMSHVTSVSFVPSAIFAARNDGDTIFHVIADAFS